MACAEALMQSASVVVNSLRQGTATLVVVSAMEGMTEWLQRQIASTVTFGYKGGDVFLRNSSLHHSLIEEVVEPGRKLDLHQRVDDYITEATGYVEAMAKLGSLSPRHYDWICARLGEGLMAPIFTAHLQGCGVDAKYYDAAEVIVTDGVFGNANPSITATRERIKFDFMRDLTGGKVLVMGGYYGAGNNKHETTFSRGGSDLTATTMGHASSPFFNDISVYLYKADVAGVMSADPKVVVSPHIVPHMLYDEAGALTALGGKVIHPKAIHHAVRAGSAKRPPITIYVKSTLDPNSSGTVIDNQERPDDDPVKAISIIKNAVSLEVRGWGMNQPGIMSKITAAIAGRGLDIDFINQPHSKLALNLAFQFAGKEADLERLVKEILGHEIKANDIDMVKARRVGVVGVIGRGLSDPLVLGKVIAGMNGDFPELKKSNAYQFASGAFEASILVDLPEDRLNQLAQSIHDSVFGN